jgi:hypothetical protein
MSWTYIQGSDQGRLPSVEIRAQSLNCIDQCTAEEDGKELGDNRRKVALRYAVKESYTDSGRRRRIRCGCAGDCRSARCVCYTNGTRCKRSDGCPDKAAGSSYT